MYKYVIEAEFKTEDEYDHIYAMAAWINPETIDVSAVDNRLFVEFESEDDRELHDWINIIHSRSSDLKLIQAGRKMSE